jgi:ribonuclease HI
MVAGMATAVPAAPAERYLHIKVDDPSKGESVNVNVPLSMAEKILPTVNKGSLHNGHVTIGKADLNDLDVRAILDALRTAQDNEFVTVKEKDQEVHVAKSNGNLIVHVRETGKDGQKVDVTVPMKVVDALLSTAKENELDVAAALHALSDAGDALLVTVQDATQHVRIWVDSRNTQD